MLEALAREIAYASAGHYWTAVVTGTVAALAAIGMGFRFLAHKRLIEDMPTARLRAAAQGYVELSGQARLFDGEQIVAPLTGRACCWYRFKVERRDRGSGRHGRDHNRWQRVDGGESTDLFMLDDGTGRCAVDPEGASITPSMRNVWYGNSHIPPRLTTRKTWLGAAAASAFGGGYRYSEEVIVIDSPLYALGFFRTHGGASTPIDTTHDATALLKEWKADRATLLQRYDRNRDGEIDATEWEHARADAHAEVAQLRASRSHAPPAVDMLSRPPHGSQPYILAARTEDEIKGRHRLLSGLCMTAGTALGLCIAWSIIARLQGPL